MEKKLCLLFVTLVLCTGLSLAFADGPIDPYRADSFFTPPSIILRSNAITLSVAEDGLVTGQEISLHANVASEKYQFSIASSFDDEESLRYNYLDRTGQESPDFTYVFQVPGEYFIELITDSNTYYERIQVKGEDFLAQKINEIVSQCPSGGEYEKALWLHDYIINHAYYDYTYTRYTAEGVLLNGFGVCDSYSQAYKKLLSAVGIQSTRVTSETHAWNAVYLESAWYNIDPTWDDPGDKQMPVSGNETHDYFGLPNSILFQIRSHQPENDNYPLCNSYGCNYNLRNNLLPWHDAIVEDIKSKIGAYEQRFELDLAHTYPLGGGWYRTISDPILPYGLSVYKLESEGVIYRNRKVEVRVDEEVPETFSINVEVHYVLDDGDRLTISADEIEKEAFLGTGAAVVELTGDCKEIQAGTFAQMPQLHEVHIPNSVKTIADDAFSGCSDELLIVAPEGSAGATFAMDNNYYLEKTSSK